ncbi:hypothetical protein SASPL_112639 [Salvia splendens]|uniref:APO domain-containing protein n=1 Tax=Salvia splendens TaxID=180675 RepID=A0A8X8YEW3_SALSN|nr:hypothetical protein SASPL_112639 [Salvia splendens]
MDAGCLHSHFSTAAFSRGKRTCLQFDYLKYSTQQGLSSFDSLKVLSGILSSLAEGHELPFAKELMNGVKQLSRTYWYRMYDRLGNRITHDERFSVPRVPTVVELCIQAGVDLQEYPTKKRRKPIIRIGKKEFVDAYESELPDLDPEAPTPEILAEIPDSEIVPPSSKEDLALLAEETLQAWEEMRDGARRLMKMYPVRVCGYCPEAAVLNDLIPPRYVWHVPDVDQPMERELRNFYGQAPAVVELCVQAGEAVPEHYKPTMRLDVGIPRNVGEAEMAV